MTVIEASRNLVKFFSENDVFFIKEDLTKVVTISLNEALDLDIVLLAMQNLVESGLVKPILKYGAKPDTQPYAYVLVKPLAEYSQTVEINFNVLSAIIDTINNFCDDLNLEKGRPNPLSITEEDLGNLIVIIDTLKNQIQPNE